MNRKFILLFGLLLSIGIFECLNPIIIIKSQSIQPYKFIVLGDTRNDEEDNSGLIILSTLLNQVINEHEIEFILHSGDLVQYGGEQRQYDTYYWPLMSNISNQVPIYYAVGNHEYDSFSGYGKSLQVYLDNVENP